jgi:peptide/nickel transport system substrate-binding protein
MIGRIRVGAIVSLVVALLIVVGCGSGGAPESSTPPGTLYVALDAEPPELDPNLSSAYVDRQVMASLYDKLVDIDQNGKIVPRLAKSYDVSGDGTVYTFKLREGVKFHDGTEFNAEAVKFNLERYQEEDSVRSTEVEPIDDRAGDAQRAVRSVPRRSD